ncbi:hypothetical protein NUACC21_82550 [Scytonema sp. NUACC21]
MEQNEQEQRRAAAKEFLKSLNELEDMLHQNPAEAEETPESSGESASEEQVAANDSSEIDLAAFEDAVADIEQYMARRNGSVGG